MCASKAWTSIALRAGSMPAGRHTPSCRGFIAPVDVGHGAGVVCYSRAAQARVAAGNISFQSRLFLQGEANMAVSMYQITVPVFVSHLNGLAGCLKKARTLYAEKKYDESTLLSYRLYPDMFNFVRQVQAATDHARKCSALLAGQEAAAYEDNEKSLAELIVRVERTVAELNALKPAQLDGSEAKSVKLQTRGGDVTFLGLDLLLKRSLPNFYFHTTTAYDIMRHNGVEIGKKDFMGG
jgi:hypothetical protein